MGALYLPALGAHDILGVSVTHIDRSYDRFHGDFSGEWLSALRYRHASLLATRKAVFGTRLSESTRSTIVAAMEKTRSYLHRVIPIMNTELASSSRSRTL